MRIEECETSLVVYLHGGSAKGNDNEAQLRERGTGSIWSWLKALGLKKRLVALYPNKKH